MGVQGMTDVNTMNDTSLSAVDTIVQAAYCQSGVSTTDYSHLCKVTNILGPTLSITTNFSVTVLIAWRGW